MSQAIPSVSNCCTPCSDSVNVSVPGPQGPAGADGADGYNGSNSFANVATAFAQPAVGANVDVEVEDARWMGMGQEVFIQNGGYYLVVSVLGNVSTLKNRGYDANVSPGTIVAAGNLTNPSGEKGETGADGTGSGDVQIVNELNEFAGIHQAGALVNLGSTEIGRNIWKVPDPAPAGIRYLKVNADKTVTLQTAADFLDPVNGLALKVGTDVQAYNAALAALSDANNVSAADFLPFYDGVGSSDVTPFTQAARNFLSDASPAAQRVRLEKVLPRKGLLAKLALADTDATADFPMGIAATRFVVTEIIVDGATTSLAVAPATGGLFKTAGGLNAIAVDQSLAACVGPNNFASLTIGGIGLTDVFIADLIFRIGTPSVAAGTCNVWVFGFDLS